MGRKSSLRNRSANPLDYYSMILFAILQRGASSSYQWGKWLLLVIALLALFCMFNESFRNVVCGECYKLRFMKRTGSPASVRTALIGFITWSGAFVSLSSLVSGSGTTRAYCSSAYS
jgi:hypothetical protein